MSLIDILLPEYDREIGVTRAVMTRSADAEQTWRPAAESRTLGQLLAHLADIPAWTAVVMTSDHHDLATDTPDATPADSAADTLSLFDSHAATGRDALVGRLDPDLTADWRLERDGALVFSLPRISVFRVLVLNHLIHHRGQLSVYLRMRGTSPPAIYGPVR